MLKETFYNRFRGWGVKPPNDAIIMHVTRSHNHKLSPSQDLLLDYKRKRIDWEEFKKRFYKEMNNDECRDVMKMIKKLSKEKDVYLVCFCFNKDKRCHRFLLMEMIENICEWCGSEKSLPSGLCPKCYRFNHY